MLSESKWFDVACYGIDSLEISLRSKCRGVMKRNGAAERVFVEQIHGMKSSIIFLKGREYVCNISVTAGTGGRIYALFCNSYSMLR